MRGDNGIILPNPGHQQPMPVVDVAALQRPLVAPFNDVQLIALVAVQCSGTAAERVSQAQDIVLESMRTSIGFGKRLKAVQESLAAEAKNDEQPAG